jgi:hypothetical protein
VVCLPKASWGVTGEGRPVIGWGYVIHSGGGETSPNVFANHLVLAMSFSRFVRVQVHVPRDASRGMWPILSWNIIKLHLCGRFLIMVTNCFDGAELLMG